MTYTIKFVNFTLGALFQKSRPLMGVRALPALHGSYAHANLDYIVSGEIHTEQVGTTFWHLLALLGVPYL